jgi:hypothetical protein
MQHAQLIEKGACTTINILPITLVNYTYVSEVLA